MPLTHDQEQEVIRLTQDIIRQPGFSGEEEPTAKIIAAKMEQLGYDEVRIDELGSVIGVINGAKPGPTLTFDGHIDVVPIREPDKWEHEPHGAEITGDILWGRGTSDMKGPDAAHGLRGCLCGSFRDLWKNCNFLQCRRRALHWPCNR